jgi:nicotinamide riboside kinase
MTKIINLFGEPGAGKSTMAAYIFAQLKVKGVNCEYIDEFAKAKVYENNDMALSHQIYMFGKSYYRIARIINNVDVIIVDSPLLLNEVYNKDTYIEPEFSALVKKVFNRWDNYNYFLSRKHKYKQEGRYQNEEEAYEVKDKIEKTLEDFEIPYTKIISNFDEADKIVTEIVNILKKEGKINE